MEEYLDDLRVAVLHGQMPSDAKEATMRAFADGSIDVLVATTVIEVGVDVANATAMVIMDADRFGISQLHQLRGRVGRGSAPSRCLLVTELPAGHPGRDRLEAVAATSDGFELSEIDLQLRREGTILAGQQHGRSDLKLLSLARDRDLIRSAREQAERDRRSRSRTGRAPAARGRDPAADRNSGRRVHREGLSARSLR